MYYRKMDYAPKLFKNFAEKVANRKENDCFFLTIL